MIWDVYGNSDDIFFPGVTYPFGEQQADKELHAEYDAFSKNRCLQIRTNVAGLQFYHQRYFKLFVSVSFYFHFIYLINEIVRILME